ncbi:unnamed protein product [Brassicogethes aeneus]|uniref:Uncharacterized protein n=1 Tax=Brassicogethes aeneus TaxID=1431903 RepID=A0A9P0AWD7_BRAAE|nr:unnamed protein product [Brassicogethes aeneus]
MRQVMTDEFVASQFTWDGSKGKIEFRMTKICKILYLASKKCPFEGPRDKVAYKNDIKEILRATKQRRKNLKEQNKLLPGLETEDEIAAQINELKQKLGVTKDYSFSEFGSGDNR